MKCVRNRSLIVYLIAIVFFLGLGFYTFEYFANARKWALNPSNPYLYSGGITDLGTITDCNEEILAQTLDNKRIYNKDSNVRKAFLHTIGDNSTSIATAVQTNYQSELWGYNIFTGLNPPDFINNKRDIKLSLNSKICCAALNSLGKNKGAVAMFNYKTGKILCMVSTPTFDPSFPPDFSSDAAREAYEGVYINRVLSASYTPGSIFKIITAASAIENLPDINSEVFTCNKTYPFQGQKIVCTGDHGSIGFKSAFAKSCNISFAKIALELGNITLSDTSKKLGFNSSFNISGVDTKKSSFNLSKATDVDLAWSGVGQYSTLVNPMHMMIIAGAIANNGIPVIPHFVEKVTSSTGTTIPSVQLGDRIMDTSTAIQLKDLMRSAVTNTYGESSFSGVKEICGKTGTAEVGKDKKPHAWFVGFSIDETTPYAFVVIVENVGGGSTHAIPIASSILKAASS